MKENNKILRAFENNYTKNSKLTFREKVIIYEGLWKEAISMKTLPLKDPLEEIEADIRVAKILNSCLKKY